MINRSHRHYWNKSLINQLCLIIQFNKKGIGNMIKNEWKSLLRNKLMLIVVIAIIVIPIIYAGLFLKSMWDPYGSVDHLPVAVSMKTNL